MPDWVLVFLDHFALVVDKLYKSMLSAEYLLPNCLLHHLYPFHHRARCCSRTVHLPLAISYPMISMPQSTRKKSLKARIKDPLWIFGIALTYFGEIFGNWFALSYISPAIVTPLGIFSVILAAALSSMYVTLNIQKIVFFLNISHHSLN